MFPNTIGNQTCCHEVLHESKGVDYIHPFDKGGLEDCCAIELREFMQGNTIADYKVPHEHDCLGISDLIALTDTHAHEHDWENDYEDIPIPDNEATIDLSICQVPPIGICNFNKEAHHEGIAHPSDHGIQGVVCDIVPSLQIAKVCCWSRIIR